MAKIDSLTIQKILAGGGIEPPEDKGNEPEMRYNVFTRAFEPIEEITDDQS